MPHIIHFYLYLDIFSYWYDSEQTKILILRFPNTEYSSSNQRKESNSDTAKTGSLYNIITDQDNKTWRLFDQSQQLTVNKAYCFEYEVENGFENIKKIQPLVNIFHQKALKEIANRNEIFRNFSVSFSYAKDIAIAKLIELDDMYGLADKIYDYMQQKTDVEFEKIGKEAENIIAEEKKTDEAIGEK